MTRIKSWWSLHWGRATPLPGPLDLPGIGPLEAKLFAAACSVHSMGHTLTRGIHRYVDH